MKYLVLMLIFVLNISICYAGSNTDSLVKKIENYLSTKKATAGIGFSVLEEGKIVTINNGKHYPMQSVYKFHLSLAVLDLVDKGKLSLDKKIFIKKSDLQEETWSPIGDKYPDGNIELPLSEIINYTVSQSDNNGCDILFKLIGGTKNADKYIHSMGIKDISIKYNEDEMHRIRKAQFSNWTTPKSAVELLKKFYLENILSKSSFDFLLKAMVNTSTGPKRIKGKLPNGTIVAHKTGSSGKNDKGISAAVNDIGIITLPDGKHLALAVFVTNSREAEDTNEEIIADIAKMVWDNYNK